MIEEKHILMTRVSVQKVRARMMMTSGINNREEFL